MLEVVIDNSALISLLANRKFSRIFISLIKARKLVVYTCKEILEELYRILEYPRVYSLLRKVGLRPEHVLYLVLRNFELKRLKKIVNIVKEDPSDNVFVSLAIQENVDYMVSRDSHILRLKRINGSKVISLKKFLEILEGLYNS